MTAKRLEADSKKGRPERDLAIYHDFKALRMSVPELQGKHRNDRTGKPLTSTAIYDAIKRVEKRKSEHECPDCGDWLVHYTDADICPGCGTTLA